MKAVANTRADNSDEPSIANTAVEVWVGVVALAMSIAVEEGT
jgi:hypothetical protein